MQENDIPGLKEAIDQEQTRRQLAFSGSLLPVAGIWVEQFTPNHWVRLGLIRSPFLGGDRGDAFSTVAVLEFLWNVSPGYQPGSFWGQLWFFAKHYRSIRPASAVAIFDYLDAAFMDSPPKQKSSFVPPSYYASTTSLCDFFAQEYGWDDTLTMSKPLARLFQYMNLNRQRRAKDAPLFNPLSDRVRGAALHKANG